MLLFGNKVEKNFEGFLGVLAALIAFFLPLNQKVVVLLILLSGLVAIFSWFKVGIKLPEKKYWPMPILFGLYLIGLFFTSNFNYGGHDIETRMTFFLFPLIYGSTKRSSGLPLKLISFSLVLGCLVAIPCCYYYANICFQEFGYPQCYQGVRLAFNMHPTYLALYMISAIVLMWYNFSFISAGIWSKIGMVFVSFVLLFMVYRFYSLGPWIGFIGMIAVLILAHTIQRKKYKLALFGSLGLLGVILISFNSLPFLKSDYEGVKEKLTSYFNNPEEFIEKTKNEINSIDSRILIWMTSTEVIKKHPFGVGTGDMKDVLMQTYRDKGMDVYVERQLNPHCQYLQTSIAIGIIGGLFLIASLFYWGYLAFKSNNFSLLAIIALFAFACLFESVLERQWGIVFFMFISTVWLDQMKNNKPTTENTK